MQDFQEQILQIADEHVPLDYHSCYLCGEELDFSYKVEEDKVIEQSTCHGCGFKNKPQQFILH